MFIDILSNDQTPNLRRNTYRWAHWNPRCERRLIQQLLPDPSPNWHHWCLRWTRTSMRLYQHRNMVCHSTSVWCRKLWRIPFYRLLLRTLMLPLGRELQALSAYLLVWGVRKEDKRVKLFPLERATRSWSRLERSRRNYICWLRAFGSESQDIALVFEPISPDMLA